MDDATPVSTRLRRTTPYHDAYTVRVHDERFASLATARPADARRWVATTRWLHGRLIYHGRLIVGLGVQWTPMRFPPRRGKTTPVPATLQLCVGHRCLVFHLARADGAVPEALRRFLADPRVTFVGSGAAHDARMLWDHYGLGVARARELRALAGMGNASVEQMAGRFLGYPGIRKPREVAMSAWHAPRLSLHQVQYASVDAFLAFRLGVVLLCPGGAAPPRPPPARRAQLRAPVQRVPDAVDPARRRAPVVVRAAPPPIQRAPAVDRQAPAPVVVRAAPPALFGVPVADLGAGAGAAIIGAHGGMTDESDTESEMDSYDDVHRAATRGLPVRAYASDSDYSVDASDEFEDVRFGVFTDEEDGEDDGSYIGTGFLRVDDNGDEDEEDEEGCNEDDQDGDEEEDCNEDDLEDEEDCNQDEENGCEQEDEDGYNEDDQNDHKGYNEVDHNDEEGYNEDDQEVEGYNYTYGVGMDGSAELVSNEVVIDGDALAQDDWYDQEVDYGFDQDDEEEFEEFCLL